MPSMSHEDKLRRISFFSNLPSEMLSALAESLRHEHCRQGDIVFQEGSIGESLYFIDSGQVKISVGSGADERILNYLGPGNFFGELAVFLDQRRTATVSVVIDADFWVLRKADLDALLEQYPENALKISHELSRRLTDTIQRPTRDERFSLVSVVGQTPWRLALSLVNLTGESVVLFDLAGVNLAEQIDGDLPERLSIQQAPPDLSGQDLAETLGILADSYDRVLLNVSPTRHQLAVKAIQQAEVTILIEGQAESFRWDAGGSLGNKDLPDWIPADILSKPVWRIADSPQGIARAARRLAQRVVGLALSSGGARGISHVGVLRVLEREGVPLDILAGTSAGALFGGLYAAGHPVESIAEFAMSFHKELSVRALLDFDIPPRTGLVRGWRFRNFLDRLFEGITFEELKMPFYVVAADAVTGEEIVFDKGPLADAVRASTSIVGVLSPHEAAGRQLIDGGAVNPLPVSVLVERGADVVLASRSIPTLEDELEAKRTGKASGRKMNILGLLGNTQSIMEREIIKTRLDLIDVLIYPRVEVYTSMDYRQAAGLIRLGEEAAEQMMGEIKETVPVMVT